jgi:1-acyl-sn-glycerol-3-phosphate acyltransferase
MKHEDLAKTVYYTNAENDEFSGIPPKGFFIPADYQYIHNNVFYRFFAFISYRIILLPIAYFHRVFALRQRFENKGILKAFKHKGYFIFGNHTNLLGGGFTPSMICFPKRIYIIVNSDNVAVKGLSTLFKMGGALPLPSTLAGMPSFMDAINKRYSQGSVICVYPEAHIWPYCTWIRPFKSVSFKFPVSLNAPVFAFTDCYKKRRFGKKPRTVTYIDGPFYPDESLPLEQRHNELRDRVYAAMKARADKESTYSIINYVLKAGSAKP